MGVVKSTTIMLQILPSLCVLIQDGLEREGAELMASISFGNSGATTGSRYAPLLTYVASY